ncbi:hypothetical protein C8R44DRAFT_746731 [Mycena epipterygia]|nr:hypothetical protein C8R44DRAFT_746731 [Mycena epipterygia]
MGAILHMDALKPEGYINAGHPGYGHTEAGAVYQRKQLQAVLKPEWYIHAVLHMDASNAEAGAVYQCNASNPGAVGSINAADCKGSKARKQGHQNEVEEGRTALSIAALGEVLPYAARGAAEIDNIELGRGCTVEYHDQELGPKRGHHRASMGLPESQKRAGPGSAWVHPYRCDVTGKLRGGKFPAGPILSLLLSIGSVTGLSS